MIKKVFILTQFGTPHEWTEEYLKNIAHLEATGWYWKIFTPNKYENVPSNVEIVPMTIEELNTLMEKKLGINPNNYLLENGLPSKHVSDFYVANGLIFEDYIKGFDFWGITNWDIVYGRLSHFIPDELLNNCDIFTDDVATINGIFSLYKNTEKVNNLFKEIPLWENLFTIHELFGTDEYHMTEVVRKASKEERIVTLFPQYYFLHSHDRLENHIPKVKLETKEDNSLWELYADMGTPDWIHARPFIGREIAYFHFIRTKRWPECLNTA